MSNRNRRGGVRSARAVDPYPDPNEGGPVEDASGHRPQRLESLIHQELQSLVRDEAADPALRGVVLVALRLSVDGSHARVAYAVEAPLAEAASVERSSRLALGRATGFLRARLAELMHLKRLPTLAFTFVGVQAPGCAPEGAAAASPGVVPVPPEGGAPWPA